jgi:hypothetical protein
MASSASRRSSFRTALPVSMVALSHHAIPVRARHSTSRSPASRINDSGPATSSLGYPGPELLATQNSS